MPGRSDRDLFTPAAAAKLLAASVKTFNKVLHSESMPARKIGREWKFSRQALIDWVGKGRSDQFYRETTSTRVALDTQAEQDERRTSGWSLSPE